MIMGTPVEHNLSCVVASGPLGLDDQAYFHSY